MLMLALNKTIDQLVMANSVHWYAHMLKRGDGRVLRRAIDFEVGQRRNGRPKMMWKKQVEEESAKVGLRRKDAPCRSKWSVGVIQIAAGLRQIGHPHLLRTLPHIKHWCLSSITTFLNMTKFIGSLNKSLYCRTHHCINKPMICYNRHSHIINQYCSQHATSDCENTAIITQ